MIAPASMNNNRLRELIRDMATEIIEDQLGFWKFQYGEMLVLVITDEGHNRMRVMAPVTETESFSNQQWQVLMSANFDRALDARYCVKDDMLWSAFIHPLQQLGSAQFRDAVEQVVTLAKNYGTSFSSGNLSFGG